MGEIKRLNDALKGYKEAIEDTDNNYDKLVALGRYVARAPYSSKYWVSFLINDAEKKGVNVSGQKREYDRVNALLKDFEVKKGKEYRDKLYNELEYFVRYYPRMVGLFFDLDPLDWETFNDLNKRDSIELLLMELKKDYDVSCMERIVSALDEVLRIKYEDHIEEIIKECPGIEIPFLPENFWWRHPSKILAEVRGRHKAIEKMMSDK